MTLKRDGRNWRLVCGNCLYAGPPYPRGNDFTQMIDAARDAGWRISRKAGVYDHTCPSCVAAETKERQGRMF